MSVKPRWNVQDIPDLSGRLALVTGANSGLGLASVVALARKGARVLMACRHPDRAARGRDAALAQVPEAAERLEIVSLDLTSLDSVRTCARTILERFDRLDILMNNAGIMAIPRGLTADGFEIQFGTNHLGHFALTGLLLPLLLQTPASRVVTVTSAAAEFGVIDFDDLMGEKRYRRWSAYSQSKLANLLFAVELQRRLSLSGCSTISLAAHPGIAATNLQRASMAAEASKFQIASLKGFLSIAQTADQGALPQLYAATDPQAEPGGFYGPRGFLQMKGSPAQIPLRLNRRGRDEATRRRLWEVSEALVGFRYPLADS